MILTGYKLVLFVFMTQRRYPIPNGIYPHTKVFGVGVYFITTNTLGGIPWFADSSLCQIVTQSLWFNVGLKHFTVFSFVIMPDHLHVLLQTHEMDISECMRSFKTNAARQLNRHLCSARGATRAAADGNGEVFRWQRRFHDHIIRSAVDFFQHLEYIRNYPVKAGLVKRAEDYPYLYVAPDELLPAL